jgi:hypothetical protein
MKFSKVALSPVFRNVLFTTTILIFFTVSGLAGINMMLKLRYLIVLNLRS